MRARIAGVVDVNRSHDIRHIGGRAADHRGVSHAQRLRQGRVRVRVYLRTQGTGYGIPLTHLDWESRREPGDALELPAFRQPWHGMGEAIEGQLPDVADHEIVVNIRR